MTDDRRYHAVLRNSAWILVNRGASGASLFVANVLFARALQPADVGLYHLALLFTTVAATLATGGLSSAAIRFLAIGGRTDRALARRLAASAAAAVGFVLAIGAVAMTYGPASWRIASLGAMVALCAAQSLRSMAAGIAQGYAEFSAQAAASAWSALILPVGAAAVWAADGGASAALWVTAAHSACIGTLTLLGLRLRRSPDTDAPVGRDVARRLRRYCVGVSALLLLDAVVWQQSEMVVLKMFAEPEDLGRYGVAFGLVVQMMQFIPGSLGAAFFPQIARLAGASDDGTLRAAVTRMTRLVALVAFPIAAWGIVIARDGLTTLYGREFSAGAPALSVLWIGGAAAAIATVASTTLYALDRVPVLLTLGVPLAVLNLALDFLLIPTGRAIGAAVANTTVQCLGAVGVMWLAGRAVGGPVVPWKRLTRMALAAAAAAVAALAARGQYEGWRALLAASAAFTPVYVGLIVALGEHRHERSGDFLWTTGVPAPLEPRP